MVGAEVQVVAKEFIGAGQRPEQPDALQSEQSEEPADAEPTAEPGIQPGPETPAAPETTDQADAVTRLGESAPINTSPSEQPDPDPAPADQGAAQSEPALADPQAPSQIEHGLQ